MGEIADMMINGDMDLFTGEYMGRGQGIPRTLDGSLPWERGKKKGSPVAGVVNYMWLKGIPADQVQSILREYATFKKFGLPEDAAMTEVCAKIQERFNDFKSWLGNQLTNRKR